MEKLKIDIGQEINKIREIRGFSKAELARKLGVTPQSVDYILKRRTIDSETLFHVSLALDHDFFFYYQNLLEQINYDIHDKKAKILVEVELTKEDLIKLNLKDRIIKTLENLE
jgi:transcriptional regulator with XRE-family HTH domain